MASCQLLAHFRPAPAKCPDSSTTPLANRDLKDSNKTDQSQTE